MLGDVNTMSETKSGWLTKKDRLARRDTAYTLTDNDVSMLISKVDSIENYISRTLKDVNPNFDKYVRLRDKALISLNWIFFKRGGEVLKLRRGDFNIGHDEISVTFTISKKIKRFKICPKCSTKNGFKNKFCRECSVDIQSIVSIVKGEKRIVTKNKTLQNIFVQKVLEWVRTYDNLRPNDDNVFLFPPARVSFSSIRFEFYGRGSKKHPELSPMTVNNFNLILQRLDPTMSSCMFRYGGTEKYLRLGYSREEMKEIGDWESSAMPEIYARKKGITPTQKRWSDDSR